MQKKIFKIVISGNKDFDDYNIFKSFCDYYIDLKKNYNNNLDIEIVCGVGGSIGMLVERYATNKEYRLTKFFPNYNKYGKSANNILNSKLVEYGDHLISFWDFKCELENQLINLFRKNKISCSIYNISKL